MELLVAAAAINEQLVSYLQGLLGLDTTTVINVLRIVGIDIVLAGDNAVVIALAITGTVSAHLGRAPKLRAALRTTGGGLLAMAITAAVGSLIGTQLP